MYFTPVKVNWQKEILFTVVNLTGDKTRKRERIRKCPALKEHGKKKQGFVLENSLYIQKMLLALFIPLWFCPLGLENK